MINTTVSTGVYDCNTYGVLLQSAELDRTEVPGDDEAASGCDDAPLIGLTRANMTRIEVCRCEVHLPTDALHIGRLETQPDGGHCLLLGSCDLLLEARLVVDLGGVHDQVRLARSQHPLAIFRHIDSNDRVCHTVIRVLRNMAGQSTTHTSKACELGRSTWSAFWMVVWFGEGSVIHQSNGTSARAGDKVAFTGRSSTCQLSIGAVTVLEAVQYVQDRKCVSESESESESECVRVRVSP
jgi:hypothetical protein